MIRDDIQNTITFIDDDEVTDFCVIPNFNLINDNDHQYYDWSFTDDYEDAVAAKTEFLIRDENSKILKDKLLCYKGCTKPLGTNINYDIEWKMSNIEKHMKEKAAEAKKKMKANIEKHISPEQQ